MMRLFWAIPLLTAALFVILRSGRSSLPPPTLKSEGGCFVFEDPTCNKRRPIVVHYFRPHNFTPDSRIVVVMHGARRNGAAYRDAWVGIAKRHGWLIVRTEFPRLFFDVGAYNQGNVETADEVETSIETFHVVERLFDRIRRTTGSQRQSYTLFGHSAGAQFVHRMVMLHTEARIELAFAANAGWYTMPDREVVFPYGLKRQVNDRELAAMLRLPLIVLVGRADQWEDTLLRHTSRAESQGSNRLQRGLTFYRAAEDLGRRLNAPLRWKLKIVAGVGHSHSKMAGVAAELALRGLDGRQAALPEAARRR